MTSICVQTIEMGSVSACPVLDLDPETKQGDRYISLILAHPTADKCLLSAALAVLRRSGDTEALRVLLEAEGAERAGPGVIDRTERAVREEVRG
jgi:hypothetical protein